MATMLSAVSGWVLASAASIRAGWFLASAALAVGAATPRALAAQDVGLPIGATPDPIVIEDLDGASVDLAGILGKKPVVLEFWATWCPLCEALEPRFEAAHRRYGDRVEFLIVGVAVNQTPRSIRRHLERSPMPGRMLWDANGAAVRAFMAPSTSYVVALDASGKVVYTGAGEDQDIEAAVAKAVGEGPGEGAG